MSNPKSFSTRMIEGHTNQALLIPTMTASGTPIKPDNLGQFGSDLWDHIVPKLVEQGIATEVDQASLESLCYWWQVFKGSQINLQSIEDTSTTAASRAVNYTSKAFDNYRRLAQQFGLTAQARNNVSANPVDAEDGFFS